VVSSSIYLSFFSSSNLSDHRLDIYHTSTHGLKCAAHGLLEMQDPKKSPKICHLAPSHNFASGYTFATKARIESTIRKNLLNSNVSPTCPHDMVNFGPLAAEICWRVWGTPAHFNGFRILAALLHGTLVLLVGVSQTLRR